MRRCRMKRRPVSSLSSTCGTGGARRRELAPPAANKVSGSGKKAASGQQWQGKPTSPSSAGRLTRQPPGRPRTTPTSFRKR